MFLLYNLLLSITLPIWFPVVWLRAKQRAIQPNWNERWGNFPFAHEKGKRRIWIHAVSVGEVLAVAPVLRELRSQIPQHEIVLSVTTSSGHTTAEGENEKSPGLYDHLVYFPFDVARCMLAAMQRVQPDVVAVMETELWMSLFWAAKVFDAKTLLINGRISDRSYPRARLIRFWYKAMFKELDRCLMQTETDAQRILSLGARTAEVFGNCKFDQASPDEPPDKAAVREEFGLPAAKPVVVIGSTRGEAEERLVLGAIADVHAWKFSQLFIVHAPRHLERVPDLQRIAREQLGLEPGLWSRRDTGRYVILDTYGDLARSYAAADVVIVGGGFEDLGGQNLIQPLALGKPVIHGPHMQNFRAAAEAAAEVGATVVAATSAELTKELDGLLADTDRRVAMREAATGLVRQHLGAGKRYAEAIAEAARSASK
ncbi:MAG TPA: glycosyltransferase N-terminal domain-containing protein [Fimbriimonadaceae bacterium]|nr:glycosyltransferase N-terminal domain-containing protein [Fimbriimonadaceae bacterium]